MNVCLQRTILLLSSAGQIKMISANHAALQNTN